MSMSDGILAVPGTVVSFDITDDERKQLTIYDDHGFPDNIVEHEVIELPFRGKVLITDGNIRLLKSKITSFGLRFKERATQVNGYLEFDDKEKERWI